MNAPIRSKKSQVLLIEDNPGDARLIVELLADPAGIDFELQQAKLLSDGVARLEQGGVDIVLLDMSLPDSVGLGTFTKCHAAAPTVPIIVMSGLDDEGLAVETVHEGAQDYLVKGQVDTRLLVRAMRYAIERKRFEEAFARERDFFHTLMDNLPDRIYFKDEQSRFTRINAAVARQFKLNHPREAFLKTDFDFFAPEHARAAQEDERRVMETGQPILGKVEREILPDGQVTWAITSKLPLKDKHGRIIGNFGISRDITTIKAMEEQLEAERYLLRSLIDNLPDYIYVKDTEGRYLLDNIAHQRFLGADSEKEVVGKTVANFFPAHLAEKFTRDDLATMQTGRALLHCEERVVDYQGSERWHSSTKVPLRNREERIIGLVGIGRDITEQKLADEQLRQANADLAQSKSQLETVLADLQKSHQELKDTQHQLVQAEKMQSVGRLAAGIAHEVKNPLGILRMGVDYLSQSIAETDANMRLILGDMADAIKRADAIIMGLLDFSAPHVLDAHPEDLGKLLDQSLLLVRRELAPPIILTKELAPNLPSVWVDKNKIKQVFVNLLTNAAHATPQGGPLLVRTYSRQLGAGEADYDAGLRLMERFRIGDTVVVAEICDSGTGIPPDKLERIFDPFYTTKPPGKGTGLGLTVTKKIIELHGGSLDVRNRKEGGVVVTIMFKV